MIMMSAGFNIEWATFLAALLVGSIGIQWSRWYLAHPKIFTVAAVIPMLPGISAYTAMISAVKIHPWLFGRDDDFAAEQFFKGLFDCGRPFDWPVDTRPVAVS